MKKYAILYIVDVKQPKKQKTKTKYMSEYLATNANFWDNKISLSTKKYLLVYLSVNILLVLLLQAFLMGMLFFIPANAQIFQANQTEELKPLAAQEILNIVNQQRMQYNLNVLTVNDKLQSAAEAKANYLLHEQIFSHSGKNGEPFSYWIKQNNYQYQRVGENLAISFTDNKKIVEAWLESETHRKNILNPYYHETGIAIKYGIYQNKPTYIVVQIFGQPLK